MTEVNWVILAAKVLVVVLLVIYFLIGILFARQTWLMNKAITTKLAGILNIIVLIHLFCILSVLILAILA